MTKILIAVLFYVFSTFASRLITALSLGWITFKVTETIVERLLDTSSAYFAHFPNTVLTLLNIGGVFEGLSMLGSAYLTAAAIRAARSFLTRVSKG